MKEKGHLHNPQAEMVRELERLRGTEKLLTRALTRLTISASGLHTSLDPLLTQLLSLLRKGDSMAVIQAEVEQVSDALFRVAVAELEKRKKETARRAKQDDTAGPDDRFTLLFSFIKSRLISGEEIAALDALLEIFRNEGEHTESELFDALELCLNNLLDARPQSSARANDDKAGVLTRLFACADKIGQGVIDLPTIQANLLALLESVETPLSLQAKARILNAKLKTPLNVEALLMAFQEAVSFLTNVRQIAQSEEKYLEDFLNELTGKLAELERQTVGVQQLTQAREAGAAELRATFEDHVEDLKLSASNATDLESLKTALSQRLESISSFLNSEREGEQKRHRETEERIALLSTRLQEMEEETAQLRSKLRVQHNMAVRDPLTGLPNRLAYDERITLEMKRFKRFATPFSLLVWDVDHFKRINDRFGHKAGDKALATIAEKLSAQIRETDFVGRFGGEEFVMILAGSSREEARRVADNIRSEIECCGFNSHGRPVAITISCGISQFLEGDSPDQLFERADQALYRAKREGRNRCVVAQ
ncbi:GGDEF domain-containing protein [Methylococcus sp. EFPC2]|uniref:sensor domain-containing diguanylate cyclase n=1 Tax=Methylococcus sp. EFPC2 TaxID=2812648 RepID=UPI0019676A0F|nr:GGDEF domain-containing protein [Methylococcus sp. EFPC2]QSA96661.1 diguanylate cyclase [Methylococcus sp. EFPC2]